MAERRRRLVIFVRDPVPGRVKTRLGRTLGMVGAAAWSRRQTARLLRELAPDPRWETWLAVTPDTAARGGGLLPAGVPRWPQGPGDLGARMGRVFRRFPPGPVVIIGADIPAVRRRHVAEAFAMLGAMDAVFGPAEDGGFWLAGLARGRRRAPAGLFRNVRWSTRHALADSLVTLADHHVGFAAPLSDVDHPEDLARG